MLSIPWCVRVAHHHGGTHHTGRRDKAERQPAPTRARDLKQHAKKAGRATLLRGGCVPSLHMAVWHDSPNFQRVCETIVRDWVLLATLRQQQQQPLKRVEPKTQKPTTRGPIPPLSNQAQKRYTTSRGVKIRLGVRRTPTFRDRVVTSDHRPIHTLEKRKKERECLEAAPPLPFPPPPPPLPSHGKARARSFRQHTASCCFSQRGKKTEKISSVSHHAPNRKQRHNSRRRQTRDNRTSTRLFPCISSGPPEAPDRLHAS